MTNPEHIAAKAFAKLWASKNEAIELCNFVSQKLYDRTHASDPMQLATLLEKATRACALLEESGLSFDFDRGVAYQCK